MANNITEQLFDAISLIASKKVADLPYDKTLVCQVIDNANADKGEYTVSDGTSEFLAYSENATYRINSKVYVTVPGNDMLNKKHIAGLYVEDSNGAYASYISPMDNFLDMTGDILQDELKSEQDGLLANGDTAFLSLWDSGEVSYKNYTCLGLQGKFTSLFNGNMPVSGNYGLAIYLTYHKSKIEEDENGVEHEVIQKDVTLYKIFYLDSSDMFGDPYNFTTGYLQEKIFSIAGMAEIVNIELIFYQSSNFILGNGSPFDSTGLNNNLFVSDIELRLGESLSQYEDDAVKLICHEDLRYSMNKLPSERTVYLRWIHKTDDGMIVIDENEDMNAIDELTYIDNRGRKIPNWTVYWYRYHLSQDVRDPLAGNFWELDYKDYVESWQRTITPNNKVQHDRWKVIIECPRMDIIKDSLIEQTDEDYTSLLENALQELQGTGASTSLFLQRVEAFITDVSFEKDSNGEDVILDFSEVYAKNRAVYPTLFNSQAINGLKSYIIAQKSKVQYYESNILTFDNEISVMAEQVDLVQGLKIAVDIGVDGHNGVYRLYNENNEIMNSHEAKKLRTLTASYTSIATGEDSLSQAEDIVWCFPLDNSMIEPPEEGSEYNTKDGDVFEIIDTLGETDDGAEQNKRLATLKDMRPDDYQDDLALTVLSAQEQMQKEIDELDIDDYDGQEAYMTGIQIINDYYQVLLGYLLYEQHYSSIISLPNNTRYGMITRTGGEMFDQPNEQLIKVDQLFRIKPYYNEAANNNTIYCFIKKYNRYYQAEATLQFGTAGTSGTEATLILTLVDSDGHEVSALTWGENESVVVRPHLYDYNNEELDITTRSIGYTWYSQPAVPEAIITTAAAQTLLIAVNPQYSILDAAHMIVSCTVDYTVTTTLEDNNGEPIEKQRPVALTAYLPIPVRSNENITHIAGANRIIYDSNGANPAYYKESYEIYTNNKYDISETEWYLYGASGDLVNPVAKKYYPTLSENNELIATNLQYENIKPISVVCESIVDIQVIDDEMFPVMGVVWVQPILILQNRYGSSMMNNWDGSLQIDEKNGTILSTMMGAGIKNDDNTFSGVLMGKVSQADPTIGNKSGLGLYGFHHGEQSFGLNVDGTAFLGKAGSGRIQFDGNKGTIQSYNYSAPHGMDGDPGSGMQIDLDDSTISAYGKTGSIIINTNKYGQPLFVIRDANYDESNKGNTLFYVASDGNDPVTGKSYSAKYFLQSANYTTVDPSGIDPNEPSESYATGSFFDLEKGKLDIHGKAGRVFIHGDGSDDLFQIRGWKGSNTAFIKNVLMNVSPNKYYLQSIDYKANESGFKLDMSTGRISAAGFNLKAGSASTGKIQINTNGSPYFSITSGEDYIEEEVLENGVSTTHYVAYDLIDLAQADAQFTPGRYYTNNQCTSGVYLVDTYYGEHVVDLEPELITPLPGDDAQTQREKADLEKTQYYYLKIEDNTTPDLVFDGVGYKQIRTLHNNDTWSFTASRAEGADRIYYIKKAEVIPDPYNTYQNWSGIEYYYDPLGEHRVEDMHSNANYIHFGEMVKTGQVYKMPKVPLQDTGEQFIENREYYELVNDEYVKIEHIAPSHDTHVIWEAKQFYIPTTVPNLFLLSTLGYAEAQDYLVPVDSSRVGDNAYSIAELKARTISAESFTPSPKKVVHPDTYFYSDHTKTLYYYQENSWTQVQEDEEQDDNTYRYAIKWNYTTKYITTYEFVPNDVPIYQAGTYYIRDTSNATYEELTEWPATPKSQTGDNIENYYYYLWYDIYVKCDKVIYTENDQNGYIYRPNTYYRYISNLPYILATDYDSSATYYTDKSLTNPITLCDINTQPFYNIYTGNDSALETFNFREYNDNGTIREVPHALYFLEPINNTLQAADSTFHPGYDYYIRYDYGTEAPDTGTRPKISSVKLINITKSRFELKSHNWNGSAGMHLFLSSGSLLSETKDVLKAQNSANDNTNTDNKYYDEEHPENTPGVTANATVYAGGGYIEGYGAYYNLSNQLQRPRFLLDWRAGSKYPININGQRFTVDWTGRVEMQDMHAFSGRIGSWYIDNNGIYSYNPYGAASGTRPAEGVALVKRGIGTGGSITMPIGGSVDNTMLRIAVGTFNVVADPQGNAHDGDDEADVTWVGSSTGFSVYKNGFVRMYGAEIKGAHISQGKIDSATINNAKITRGTIDNAKIGSGTIGGWTINKTTLTGGNTTLNSSGRIDCEALYADTGGKIGPFTITSTALSGSGVELESGKITCKDLVATKGGEIGPFTISGTELSSGSAHLTATSFKIGDWELTGNKIGNASSYLQNALLKLGDSCTLGPSSGLNCPNGPVKCNGITCTGNISASGKQIASATAIFSSSLQVGSKVVQMETAGCTIEQLKTALGLKALAYEDDVTKNFKVSLTASAGGGSTTLSISVTVKLKDQTVTVGEDSTTVKVYDSVKVTVNGAEKINTSSTSGSTTYTANVAQKTVTMSKTFSNTKLTAGTGDVSLTANSGVSVSQS